jgi:hypothetical protein
MRKIIRNFLEHVEDTLLEELEDVSNEIEWEKNMFGDEAELLFAIQVLKIQKSFIIFKLSLVQSVLNWI